MAAAAVEGLPSAVQSDGACGTLVGLLPRPGRSPARPSFVLGADPLASPHPACHFWTAKPRLLASPHLEALEGDSGHRWLEPKGHLGASFKGSAPLRPCLTRLWASTLPALLCCWVLGLESLGQGGCGATMKGSRPGSA